jgi:SsrA-binding protein
MARPKPTPFDKQRTVADNRRARYDYHIDEKFEAGLALQGTEVKALRAGEASIRESYAEVSGGEVWLINANIPEYSHGNRLNHEPKRPRKLLLYFNSKGRAKVELALAKGKQAQDKRAAVKDRDWKRDKARLMRDRG